MFDMVMPGGIDGLETYRRIVEIYPNQNAIIASGYSETKRVKTLQGLGAGTYIQKLKFPQNRWIERQKV